MKRITTLCTLAVLVLVAAPAVFADDELIDRVEPPLVAIYPGNGEAPIALGPNHWEATIIPLKGIKKVHIMIGRTQASRVKVIMGRIGGRILAQSVVYAVDSRIHTIDVVGPAMQMFLIGGPPNTTESVSLWVYLQQ